MNAEQFIQDIKEMLEWGRDIAEPEGVEISRHELFQVIRAKGYDKHINPLSFAQDDFARAGIRLSLMPNGNYLARTLKTAPAGSEEDAR